MKKKQNSRSSQDATKSPRPSQVVLSDSATQHSFYNVHFSITCAHLLLNQAKFPYISATPNLFLVWRKNSRHRSFDKIAMRIECQLIIP